MTSRRLTPDQVHAIGRAAAENALDLMSDAMVLAQQWRLRRAYALGVIAVEEVAKGLYCREQLNHWTGLLTAHGVKAALRPGGTKAHLDRYLTTLQYLWVGAPEIPLPPGYSTLEEVVRADMAARERTLYVDVSDSGEVMDPSGVSDEESATWLEAMGKVFADRGAVWLTALDEALERAHTLARGSTRQAEGELPHETEK